MKITGRSRVPATPNTFFIRAEEPIQQAAMGALTQPLLVLRGQTNIYTIQQLRFLQSAALSVVIGNILRPGLAISAQ
jgi:hypothetical protein